MHVELWASDSPFSLNPLPPIPLTHLRIILCAFESFCHGGLSPPAPSPHFSSQQIIRAEKKHFISVSRLLVSSVQRADWNWATLHPRAGTHGHLFSLQFTFRCAESQYHGFTSEFDHESDWDVDSVWNNATLEVMWMWPFKAGGELLCNTTFAVTGALLNIKFYNVLYCEHPHITFIIWVMYLLCRFDDRWILNEWIGLC